MDTETLQLQTQTVWEMMLSSQHGSWAPDLTVTRLFGPAHSWLCCAFLCSFHYTLFSSLLLLLYYNAVHLLQTALSPDPQKVGSPTKGQTGLKQCSVLWPGRHSKPTRLLMHLGLGLQWLYPTGCDFYIHHPCVLQAANDSSPVIKSMSWLQGS